MQRDCPRPPGLDSLMREYGEKNELAWRQLEEANRRRRRPHACPNMPGATAEIPRLAKRLHIARPAPHRSFVKLAGAENHVEKQRTHDSGPADRSGNSPHLYRHRMGPRNPMKQNEEAAGADSDLLDPI